MTEKLLKIIMIIKEADGPITANRILDILLNQGVIVSLRTLYKDIQDINQGFKVVFGYNLIKSIKKRGYEINQDLFTDGQIQYLMDCISFDPNIDGKEARQLQDKLLGLTSVSQRTKIRINPVDNDQEINYFLNLTNIIKAINQKTNIAFTYIDYDIMAGKVVEVKSNKGNRLNNRYVISPYSLELQDGNYYIRGYFDKRKNQYSIYRLDRMRNVISDSSTFVDISEQYDLTKESKGSINNFYGERADLRISFKKEVFREIVNRFGKNLDILKVGHDWYDVKIKDIAISDGLIGWILMMNTNVKVIYPGELKEKIRAKIEAVAALY